LGKDVYIELDTLRTLATQIEEINTELKAKDSLQDQLKTAIGQPMGHYELQSKVGSTDPVTEDLLIGQAKELELFQWFVRSHLETA